eukprot:4729321-Amphidinium_carterae.1
MLRLQTTVWNGGVEDLAISCRRPSWRQCGNAPKTWTLTLQRPLRSEGQPIRSEPKLYAQWHEAPNLTYTKSKSRP